MKETLLPLFSSLIMVSNVDINEKEKNILNNFIDKSKFIRTREDQNSCSISEDYYVLDNEELAPIRNKIALEVNKYIEHLKYKGEFDFSSSWVTLTKPEEQSHYHTHGNTIFSGIYYFKTVDECGNIVFTNFNKTNWGINKKEANVYNSSTWEVAPTENRIILFPSDVPHKININKSKFTRISLAFNVIPKGEIGNTEQKIYIYGK